MTKLQPNPTPVQRSEGERAVASYMHRGRRPAKEGGSIVESFYEPEGGEGRISRPKRLILSRRLCGAVFWRRRKGGEGRKA